jgi:hypothetical protein
VGVLTSCLDGRAESPPTRSDLPSSPRRYWRALPEYQRGDDGAPLDLDSLEVQRLLFGVFPAWRDAPAPPAFDRVIAAGDACGLQSPLSFGGLAALARHAGRLVAGVKDAVDADLLDRGHLRFLNAYNPSLSSAWLQQRALRVPADAAAYDRAFVNRLLGGTFAALARLGDAALRPFLADVLQPGPLARALAAQVAADPLFVFAIVARLGPGPIADWALHFAGMCAYQVALAVAEKAHLSERAEGLPPRARFFARRALERWRFGAGLDYEG